MNAERLLARFLQYVQIDTTASESSQSYPSSAGQWELGALLVRQLRELRLDDVQQDEHGLVWATIPATAAGDIPAIAFNAHLDTSPETSGTNVRPQVIRNYAGGDLALPGDPQQVIRVAENPALEALHGATLITTDGTTLLGSDDKAGLAVIVEAAAYLTEHRRDPPRSDSNFVHVRRGDRTRGQPRGSGKTCRHRLLYAGRIGSRRGRRRDLLGRLGNGDRARESTFTLRLPRGGWSTPSERRGRSSHACRTIAWHPKRQTVALASSTPTISMAASDKR